MKNIIYSPLASLVLLVLSGSFFLTFITIKLNINEVTVIMLGLIHSAFYGGILIGALKSEEIINRVGHIRAFASFSSILTITILLQATYQTPYIWILLRFCAGFATAAAYVIIESWLLAQSTKYNKGKILSVYMICLYSAQTAGQFGLDILDINSLEPFILAAIISSVSIIPASLTYVPAPEIKPMPKLAINKYFSASPLGFMGCISSGLILSAIYSFLPKYAVDNDFSVSMMLGLTIAGGFCLQWPIGKLSDTFDRTKIIIILSLVIAVICLLLAVVHFHEVLIYTMMFIFGGLCFTIYPLCIAQVCDHLEHGNIINVTGVLLFAYGVGAVLGPPIVSLFMEMFSAVALLYYVSFVSFVLFLFGLYRNKIEKNIPQDEQVEFIAMPRVSPMANELDPRVDNELITEENKL